MQPVKLQSFRQKVRHHKTRFKRFLTKLEKKPPRNLDKTAQQIDEEVWKETDCLTCANCCKTMTPVFTNKDLKRISEYLNMTVAEMKDKWLVYEKKDKDWINKKMPCQFLNLENNLCSIYDVRPESCAGFPHLARKKMTDYMHVHKQNVEYCPATFKMVEKMMEKLLN